MKITITITPQRIILFVCIFGLWWCFIGFTGLSDVTNTQNIWTKFAIFSSTENYEIKLKHTQRILTSDDSSTNNNPNIKFPPIPSIIGIGPEKCGTTSLAYMLTRNPQKIPEIIKPLMETTGVDCEMRYWLPCGNVDQNETLNNVLRDGAPTKPENFCSLGWYQHFWNPHYDDIRFKNAYSTKNDWIKWKYYYYFEKSPAYWSYDHVAFLFGKLLAPQGSKFFVLMRDPIKRTYSYWSHQTELGHINIAWHNYVQTSINDKNIKNIINLLKDKSKSITDAQMKGKLLMQWTEYVYNKPYGFIGKRDNSRKQRGPKGGKHLDDRTISRLRERYRNRNKLRNDMSNKENNNQNNNENNNENKDKDDASHSMLVERFRKQRMNRLRRNRPGNVGRNLLGYNDSNNSTKRRRLLRQSDYGYIDADSNPFLGVGASCYVVPLLMWLKYIPSTQIILLQSELMYGGNHDNFISDLRCWFSLGYEYETMQQCLDDGKKKVVVGEEHMVHSSRGKILSVDAEYLYNEFFTFCNERLKELLSMDKYKHLTLHEVQWDAWFSSGK